MSVRNNIDKAAAKVEYSVLGFRKDVRSEGVFGPSERGEAQEATQLGQLDSMIC